MGNWVLFYLGLIKGNVVAYPYAITLLTLGNVVAYIRNLVAYLFDCCRVLRRGWLHRHDGIQVVDWVPVFVPTELHFNEAGGLQ